MTVPRKKNQPKPYVDFAAQREEERALERMLRSIRSENDFAFLDEPPKSRHSYGRSESEPGRLCSTCRTFVSGQRSTPCPDCRSVDQ